MLLMLFKKHIYKALSKRPQKAYEVLFKAFGKKLFLYAVKNYGVSEDVSWGLIYSTLEKVSKRINEYKFENDNQVNNLIFKAFLNALKNHFRSETNNRKHLEITYSDELEKIEQPVGNNLEASEKVIIVQRALQDFEPWQRDLLLLKAQGLTYKEIEGILQIPSDNLKVYFGRLKKKLEEQILLINPKIVEHGS